MPICPQCGQAFDGDQCGVCLARVADVQRAFFRFQLYIALAGFLGTIFALMFYPPLTWDSIAFNHLLDFIVIPGVIVFLLVHFNKLARYAAFVKLMLGLASATLLILAAFLFLNGALDRNLPIEARAIVSRKFVSHAKGPTPVLELDVEWNQQEIKKGIDVKRETFSVVEQGDSVNLEVHPGAFSVPWYGDGRIMKGNDAITLRQNRH